MLPLTRRPALVETSAAGPPPGAAQEAARSSFELLPGSLLGVILGMAGLWKGEGRERAVPRARVKLVF